MLISKRTAIATCVFALMAFSGSAKAATDGWPTRPITWMVGYSPGGSVDIITRVVARRMEAQLGQPIVVENRPGGAGVMVLSAVARAPADGYTVMTLPGPVVQARPQPAIGKELIAMAGIANSAMVLVGGPASTPSNVRQLLADMKKRPDSYSYATSGAGTAQHLAGELMNIQAGLKAVHIPYKGGNQAVTDVISGQVQLGILGITTVQAQAKSGKLKAYAVTTATRSTILPDVPTMKEAGLPDFDAAGWFVVAGPAGVPADRVHTFESAMQNVLRDPSLRAEFQELGLATSPMTAKDATVFVQRETKRWTDLAVQQKLELE